MSWSKAPVGLSQLFSTMTVNKQSTCYQLAQWLWLWERESRMGGTFCFREGHSSHICFRFTPCLPLLVCMCVCGCVCLRTNVCVGFVCWITLADLNLWSQRDADDKGVRDETGLPWRRLDFWYITRSEVCVWEFVRKQKCVAKLYCRANRGWLW